MEARFLSAITGIFAIWLVLLVSHRIDVYLGAENPWGVPIFGFLTFCILYWALKVVACLLRKERE